MTQNSNFSRGYRIVTRWRVLAEQRLEHLNELYATGRWRRYHTEQAFVDNIRDAKRAVEAWRKLAPAPESAAECVASNWLGNAPHMTAAVLPAARLPDRVRAKHDLREA